MTKWNIFTQRLLKCYHPALEDFEEPANWFPAAVCKNDDGTMAVIFNLGYIINLNATGFGGSGHAVTSKNAISFEFDEASNMWLMRETDGQQRIYRFALPDRNLLAAWDNCWQYTPTLEVLQKKAAEEFRYILEP